MICIIAACGIINGLAVFQGHQDGTFIKCHDDPRGTVCTDFRISKVRDLPVIGPAKRRIDRVIDIDYTVECKSLQGRMQARLTFPVTSPASNNLLDDFDILVHREGIERQKGNGNLIIAEVIVETDRDIEISNFDSSGVVRWREAGATSTRHAGQLFEYPGSRYFENFCLDAISER